VAYIYPAMGNSAGSQKDGPIGASDPKNMTSKKYCMDAGDMEMDDIDENEIPAINDDMYANLGDFKVTNERRKTNKTKAGQDGVDATDISAEGICFTESHNLNLS
jgi:hypothetical protein